MTSGLLTDHCAVFPNDWDMVVELEDRAYWVCDSYCLNPSCRCRKILFLFTDLEIGKDIGSLRVDLGDWKRPEIEGGAETARLWKTFIEEKGRKQEVRRRFREMKRVSAALPEALGEAGPAIPKHIPDEPGRKVGRNAPCPCGSGRKFKRCCGRPRRLQRKRTLPFVITEDVPEQLPLLRCGSIGRIR
jgi:hypothetical protein